MRVLIADDEVVSRTILQKVLEGWGLSVVACDNGTQAWERFGEEEFRLTILDWMMPGMDGLELCRRIRELSRIDYSYVMLLTVRNSREDFLEAMDAGADDYLTKPLDIAELKARLRVAERILTLQSDVRKLHRIMPICAWCKKIRDERESWLSIEDYIAQHTQSDFSHSICPECAVRIREDRAAGRE